MQEHTADAASGNKKQAVQAELLKQFSRDMAFNLSLKKKLEDVSKEAAGGGWWVEQHIGKLFFCCKCVPSTQITYVFTHAASCSDHFAPVRRVFLTVLAKHCARSDIIWTNFILARTEGARGHNWFVWDWAHSLKLCRVTEQGSDRFLRYHAIEVVDWSQSTGPAKDYFTLSLSCVNMPLCKENGYNIIDVPHWVYRAMDDTPDDRFIVTVYVKDFFTANVRFSFNTADQPQFHSGVFCVFCVYVYFLFETRALFSF